MAKISAKDNFLKLAGGGHPEYVPFFTMMGSEGVREIPIKRAGPAIWGDSRFSGGSKDMWGVTYVATEETANASLPEPGEFLVNDITKWHETVKRPNITENIDWEAMAKADIERINIDRSQTALSCGTVYQPFQQLMAFLGHGEGLIAMSEEPEAVKELQEFMISVTEPYYEKILDYYQPDIWCIGDDTCTEYAPFFSVEMYREFFKPIYTRMAQAAVNRGLPVLFHICGMIEPFVPEMLDFGVKYIEPTQESNDIIGLKEQFKGRVSFIGGFDYGRHVPAGYPNFSEEDLRQDVRDTIDKYSPNGGWGMFAWPISYLGDPVIDEVKKIIWDESDIYGRKVYGYTE
ncbi:MAG: hypothetical protein FWG30_07030 [Eubacteriaceae bacterium]|nr:hypothetical protein [Eubacteriaceae bacterium]